MTDAEALSAAAKLVPSYYYICWSIGYVDIPREQNIRLKVWIRTMLGTNSLVSNWLINKGLVEESFRDDDPRAIAYRQAWCEHLAKICEREDEK